MIELIVNIVLIAAGIAASYMIGKKHGEEVAFDRCMEDSSYEDGFEDGSKYGYKKGFNEAKTIGDIEFIELLAATQSVATPKKVAKKKVSKKSK